MTWDTSELRRRFLKPGNADVIGYLSRHHPSAHSDLTDELFLAADPDGTEKSYCPDGPSYAYVLLYTGIDIIYAIAIGMKQIAFRLPTSSISAARLDGGEGDPQIGSHWITFRIFQPGNNITVERARLKHWCGIAALHASDPDDASSLSSAT